MNENDNPYVTLVESMIEEGAASNPIPFMIGEVISVNTLAIKIGDIQLDRDDVLINESLLKGYTRNFKVEGYADDTAKRYVAMDDFKIGDKLVLLISQDQQEIVILCKVR